MRWPLGCLIFAGRASIFVALVFDFGGTLFAAFRRGGRCTYNVYRCRRSLPTRRLLHRVHFPSSSCSLLSVVLRNCINCRVLCASQQFRCRDCRCLDIFLLCSTKPSIEASQELRFGCFSFYYRELAGKFVSRLTAALTYAHSHTLAHTDAHTNTRSHRGRSKCRCTRFGADHRPLPNVCTAREMKDAGRGSASVCTFVCGISFLGYSAVECSLL